MPAPSAAEPERETNPTPPHGWTCFHCGEHFPPTFVGQRDAAYHFGTTPDATPACKLDRKEKALLMGVRNLEAENARYRAEDSHKDRAMAALRADHAQALRREEEIGYARGLRDGRELIEPLRQALQHIEDRAGDMSHCSTSRCGDIGRIARAALAQEIGK